MELVLVTGLQAVNREDVFIAALDWSLFAAGLISHQELKDRLLQSASRGPAGPERLLCGAAAQQVPR